MAGIRDTWQTNNPLFELSRHQASALLFWSAEDWLGLKDPFDGTKMANMLDIGRAVFAKRLAEAKKALSQAWLVTSDSGIRCLIFGSTTLTSDVAEMVHDVDLVVGFGFIVEDGKFLLNVSTRSHTDFDCAALAKRFGGGGHTKAAGFTLPFALTDKNPYAMLLGLVDGGDPSFRPSRVGEVGFAGMTTYHCPKHGDVIACACKPV